MVKKYIIHLVNEKKIEIEETYVFKDNILNKMNDRDDAVMLGKYIIPKSSIDYIEFIESEEE